MRIIFVCFVLFVLNTGSKPSELKFKDEKVGDMTENLNPDMIDLVNYYRQRGCNCGNRYMPPAPPLIWDNKIESAAMRHAKDMNLHTNYDHKGTDRSDPARRLDQAGYEWSAVAENIAWGYNDFKSVLVGWMKSPSHCKNIMSTKFTHFGAARYGDCWVQDFAKPLKLKNYSQK
jgi:uncharacterized protein YkwD